VNGFFGARRVVLEGEFPIHVVRQANALDAARARDALMGAGLVVRVDRATSDEAPQAEPAS
jgi:hypothetical protein